LYLLIFFLSCFFFFFLLFSTFLNFQANANGTVLRSEILGVIKMRVYLTGMPELRLGLNDKLLFEATGRCENFVDFFFINFFS